MLVRRPTMAEIRKSESIQLNRATAIRQAVFAQWPAKNPIAYFFLWFMEYSNYKMNTIIGQQTVHLHYLQVCLN